MYVTKKSRYSDATKKVLCIGPKYFDKLEPDPGPTRKARADIQLWPEEGRIMTLTQQWRYLNLTRNSFYILLIYFLQKVPWVIAKSLASRALLNTG